MQNPQNLSQSTFESRNHSIHTRQSIGDAEPDDPRLGGIGQKRKKRLMINLATLNAKHLLTICFQKTTWGLKVYYCHCFCFQQVIIVGRQTDGGYNRHGAAISPNIVHFAIFLSMFPTEALKARLGRARGPWRNQCRLAFSGLIHRTLA